MKLAKVLTREETAKNERDEARTRLEELAKKTARETKVLMEKEQIYRDERDALLRAIDKVRFSSLQTYICVSVSLSDKSL